MASCASLCRRNARLAFRLKTWQRSLSCHRARHMRTVNEDTSLPSPSVRTFTTSTIRLSAGETNRFAMSKIHIRIVLLGLGRKDIAGVVKVSQVLQREHYNNLYQVFKPESKYGFIKSPAYYKDVYFEAVSTV